jgi:hypothetical protein
MEDDVMTRTRSSLLTGQTRALVLALLLVVAFGVYAQTTVGQATAAIGEAAAAVAGQRGSGQSGSDSEGLACGRGAEPFLRTELYFGSNKPDGTVVTEREFQRFLNDVITPRFPDGLTLLTGLGQFRGSNGVIQRERSMLLILLYPRDSARSSGQKIEEIRAAYLKAFDQESVLRADGRLPECVSF